MRDITLIIILLIFLINNSMSLSSWSWTRPILRSGEIRTQGKNSFQCHNCSHHHNSQCVIIIIIFPIIIIHNVIIVIIIWTMPILRSGEIRTRGKNVSQLSSSSSSSSSLSFPSLSWSWWLPGVEKSGPEGRMFYCRSFFGRQGWRTHSTCGILSSSSLSSSYLIIIVVIVVIIVVIVSIIAIFTILTKWRQGWRTRSTCESSSKSSYSFHKPQQGWRTILNANMQADWVNIWAIIIKPYHRYRW